MTAATTPPTTATQPITYGRRATDYPSEKDGRLSFGLTIDKVFLGVLSGMCALLVWLCVNMVDLRQQMAIVVERSTRTDEEFRRLTTNDKRHDEAINSLKVEAARHGWNTGAGNVAE